MDAGYQHSAVCCGGRVWIFGSNSNLQAGISEGRKSIGHFVEGLEDIIHVSCGYSHTATVDNFGIVWTFGSNKEGQLGRATASSESDIPEKVIKLPLITQVACGLLTLCLDENNNVWCFGSQEFRSSDFTSAEILPRQIPELCNIHSVHTGQNHSICLDRDGFVWGFGDNDIYQIGLKEATTVKTPTIVPDLENITHVSVGYSHSAFLNEEGRVLLCGYGSQGQLGRGKNTDNSPVFMLEHASRVKKVMCGYFHTCIVNEDGDCYVTGNNNFYQLGLGHNNFCGVFTRLQFDDIEPIILGGLHSVFRVGPCVMGCGRNEQYELGLKAPETLKQLTELTASSLLIPSRAKSARK
eukprot:CAMPEP_0206182660 /NCGR_PEP_ID=MMETSP0166-20121206/190_1 /ASSEMBLY_ACC=CAM_ASM_000260 /TAXON_ID=95228 /ORGANISM="Vannella robusta, Strain DIVA3 518/3/11/1/6" /LENGTH=352 /DNA_ID=CAMNT_0053597397 /DNA_START=63 /DNA_END=1121 /DNA_ORIENTATION=-